MGSGLRKLVTKYKGHKLSDSKTIGGRGRLTKKQIDSFQVYYGKAIQQNAGNIEAASNAVRAILKHSASTDKNPQHDLCPPGESSWCKWQVAKAKGIMTYKHKNPLPPAVVKVVTPLFEQLSDKTLLATTKDCLTQNSNESLHHLIWDKCPKTGFTGLGCVQIATCFAVLEFNFGHSSYNEIISTMGIDPGFYARDAFAKCDRQWLYFANVKSSPSYKEKRVRRRAQKHAFEDQQERAEGTLYKSGSFLPTSETSPPLPTRPRACPRCRKCGKPRKGHRRGQACPGLSSK